MRCNEGCGVIRNECWKQKGLVVYYFLLAWQYSGQHRDAAPRISLCPEVFLIFSMAVILRALGCGHACDTCAGVEARGKGLSIGFESSMLLV